MTTKVSTPIVFDWLFAGTTYQLSGYVDTSAKTGDPVVSTVTFQTKPIPDCQPFQIKLVGYAPRFYNTTLIAQLAPVMGVNPLRLLTTGYTSVRRLQDNPNAQFSTFSFTLVPERSWETPTPSEQTKFSDSQLATLTANLLANNIANNISSITNEAVPARGTPTWEKDPSLLTATNFTISISLRAKLAGQSCCIHFTSETVLTSEQVLLGLDASNQPVDSICIASDLTADTNTIIVTGLKNETEYFFYCITTDSYPLWPALSATPASFSAKTLSADVVHAVTCLLSIFALLFPLL
jgi:hypothetical protein